jgi:hypothetical protein
MWQVGNWTTESGMWGRPEDDKLKRSVYYVTTKNGAQRQLPAHDVSNTCLIVDPQLPCCSACRHLLAVHTMANGSCPFDSSSRQMLHPWHAGC